MSIASRLRSWRRALTRRDDVEQSQLEEWQFHIDQRAAALEREGLTPREARRRARAEFGGVDARREESRDALGLRLLDELVADLRYAVRALRQSPTFAAVAILSLGLGIGANTAMFSLMETLLWKTLPVARPDQLRQVWWVSGPNAAMSSTWGNELPTATGGRTSSSLSYAGFLAIQQAAEAEGASVSAFKSIGRLTAIVDGRAEMVVGELVSGDLYRAIGVTPVVGRAITPADDRRDADVVVGAISHGFWSRRFGRDPGVVGRTISVNQVPVTVVGVNPPAFTGFDAAVQPDVFLPITAQPVVLPYRYGGGPSLLDANDSWWVLAMARVPDGLDERRLQTALDVALGNEVRPLLLANAGRDRPHVRLTPGGRGVDDLRREFTRPLLVLTAFVGVVLLIACANLANLLLARAAARQREIGLRLALGAGPARIARQLLTEGLVLASLGGACGIVLGFWLRDGIPYLLGTSWQPGPLQADFSSRVLWLTLAVTLATGLLFSLAPIWQATRVRVASSLKDGGRSSAGRARSTARRGLVVMQVAMSVVLLVGAGLFVRTLLNLRSADLGFTPQRVVLFTVDPPRARFSGPARAALFARIEEAVARVPGIESTTLTAEPLVAGGGWTTRARPSGREARGDQDRTWVNDVGTHFFETMRIPILQGRAFTSADRPGAPRAAVVNQQFAKKFFPDVDPIGRTFVSSETVYHVVGVSADARYERISAPMPPTFYKPYRQADDLGGMTFAVRTGLGTGAVERAIRDVAHGVDRDVPVSDFRTQLEQIDATLSQQRLFAALTTAFGGLALVLAAIGIYGVIAGSVASRVTEIGVRMALGAERRDVLMMILREAVTLSAIGVLVGLAVASGVVRHVASYLYELTPFDPVAAGMAVLLIVGVALLSGWWPARAASRLDPMQALRHD